MRDDRLVVNQEAASELRERYGSSFFNAHFVVTPAFRDAQLLQDVRDNLQWRGDLT